jgi:hypothetical protein
MYPYYFFMADPVLVQRRRTAGFLIPTIIKSMILKHYGNTSVSTSGYSLVGHGGVRWQLTYG